MSLSCISELDEKRDFFPLLSPMTASVCPAEVSVSKNLDTFQLEEADVAVEEARERFELLLQKDSRCMTEICSSSSYPAERAAAQRITSSAVGGLQVLMARGPEHHRSEVVFI